MPPKKPKANTYTRHRKRLNITLGDNCRRKIAEIIEQNPELGTVSRAIEWAVYVATRRGGK